MIPKTSKVRARCPRCETIKDDYEAHKRWHERIDKNFTERKLKEGFVTADKLKEEKQ